ncbi:MAG: antitoxin [Planctomycetes bacterium RBG_16_43_13]|nr:MAG: antitoxin [Planctomycetes bacterium RBG_16_43_13]
MSKYITVNPKVMCGKPCFRGTRIPVYIVLGLMANGATADDVLRDYPDLTKQHIRAALRYATELAREEVGAL